MPYWNTHEGYLLYAEYSQATVVVDIYENIVVALLITSSVILICKPGKSHFNKELEIK